ncbi:hypothetical protein CEXT_2771 [Caerostris extrusa]|uniref:Uncharacterized protein n=1 Tax=Caerostris extrusa TaxID=172846 RepID=A0AAV4R0C6_CAEEX|nr:hypothetical protein CEXT_2771 [Caerostris extrusa]
MAVSTIQSLARDRDTPFTPSGWQSEPDKDAWIVLCLDILTLEENNPLRILTSPMFPRDMEGLKEKEEIPPALILEFSVSKVQLSRSEREPNFIQELCETLERKITALTSFSIREAITKRHRVASQLKACCFQLRWNPVVWLLEDKSSAVSYLGGMAFDGMGCSGYPEIVWPDNGRGLARFGVFFDSGIANVCMYFGAFYWNSLSSAVYSVKGMQWMFSDQSLTRFRECNIVEEWFPEKKNI